jgi:Domain of unknown function (DUF4349)
MKRNDEQIGAELYALRETPSEEFAARLDRRVAAGFADQPKVKQSRELTWGRLLPALGTLAAIAVVAVAISNSGSGGGSGGGTDNAATPSAAPPETIAPAGGTNLDRGAAVAGNQVLTEPVAPTSRPRNSRPQVQEQTAQVGLATDADKLQGAADGVVDVTDRYDGIVDSSNVHTGGSRGRASFELRIPTQHLQDAVSDLSDLGRVTMLNQGSNNVTGTYVDTGKAYADARANVGDLRGQLRNASSQSEAAAIRAQLDVARRQLAAARAALRSLKQRVAYTPISVEITAQGDGSWSIGDAADDAVGVLEAIGGAVLIALAVLIPLGALLALGWLGTRELRRRRREAALD